MPESVKMKDRVDLDEIPIMSRLILASKSPEQYEYVSSFYKNESLDETTSSGCLYQRNFELYQSQLDQLFSENVVYEVAKNLELEETEDLFDIRGDIKEKLIDNIMGRVEVRSKVYNNRLKQIFQRPELMTISKNTDDIDKLVQLSIFLPENELEIVDDPCKYIIGLTQYLKARLMNVSHEIIDIAAKHESGRREIFSIEIENLRTDLI